MDFIGRKGKRVLAIGFLMSILVLVSACKTKSRVIDTKFTQEMTIDSLKTSLLLTNMSHLRSENVRIIAVKWSAPDSLGHQYKLEEVELVQIVADSCVSSSSLESSLQSHIESEVVQVSKEAEKVQQGANKWHLRVFCLLSAIILLTILFAWIRKKAFLGL